MDAVNAVHSVEPEEPMFLPPESPLAMAPGDLSKPAQTLRGAERGLVGRRVLIFAGAGAFAIAGSHEMYAVLDVGGVTALEWALLALFVALFAWVAFSFMSALAGFFVTLTGAAAGIAIDETAPPPALASRTAMLLPTYNEDPHQVAARLRAMVESVDERGRGEHFDWLLLSDTTDPDIWIEEEAAFLALRRSVPRPRALLPPPRRQSRAQVRQYRRLGRALRRRYEHMLVLDADSLMSGDTIVRLAHAMETHARRGADPDRADRRQRAGACSRGLQQFAGRVYGPMVIAGNAWWHGPDGNYWGHNAMIRTRAFAEQAGLPELSGRKPFGGHILSHDFIEAALMRRAGWAVYAAPTLGGSYEEAPPSLIDFAVRDRRWCQGNLQHLAVLPARGLRWMSRLHLLVGIGSYLTAPMWFAFLILGLLISLQAAFVRPEYFPKGFSLFPAWPRQDPVLAAWVFAGTMGLLILPKFMAYLTHSIASRAPAPRLRRAACASSAACWRRRRWRLRSRPR